MTDWLPQPEMQWKFDGPIDAARAMPGWRDFHKTCAEVGLFFDHMFKRGRDYVCCAFGRDNRLLATGAAREPLEALRAAHDESGRVTTATAAALRRIDREIDDFEELL